MEGNWLFVSQEMRRIKSSRNEPCAVVLVVISLCLIIGFDLRIELSLDKRVLLFA